METALAKPEWGLKRTCLGCGARFYDMQRDPIICPSCETEFDPLALVRPRRARAAANEAKAKVKEKAAPEGTVAEEGELLVDEDDDALAVEDDIDLGDDGEDDLLTEDDEQADIADDPDVSEAMENAKD